jgi:hypothetical protein
VHYTKAEILRHRMTWDVNQEILSKAERSSCYQTLITHFQEKLPYQCKKKHQSLTVVFICNLYSEKSSFPIAFDMCLNLNESHSLWSSVDSGHFPLFLPLPYICGNY